MSLGFRVLVLGGKGSGGCDLGLECIFMGGGVRVEVSGFGGYSPVGSVLQRMGLVSGFLDQRVRRVQAAGSVKKCD